jgi:rhodanese-related sulfurtransferase/DNA-binding transcriptional ArsR family regulator
MNMRKSLSPTQRRFKDRVYEQLAKIGKALAAPKRLELLDCLGQGPSTVDSLAEQTAITVANASQHLKVLRAVRLVDTERRGPYVEYRLQDPGVGRFLVELRELAETHLAELEQVTRGYFDSRGGLETTADDELVQRVRAGEVTVVDVREAGEYRAGHLPGALHIPLGELDGRAHELRKDQAVVIYCRGPYCVTAVEAVELLRKKGFRAYRLTLGVSEWRARRWRLDRAASP